MATENRTSARTAGWHKQFAATCLGAAAALCAAQTQADDYYFWSGGAGDFLFSSPGNWLSDDGAPVPGSTLAIQSCDGQTLTNDLPFGPYNSFSQSDGSSSYRIVGNPIGLAKGVNNSENHSADRGSEQIYDLPVTFTGWGKGAGVYSTVRAQAGTRIVFAQPLHLAPSNDFADVTALFDGAGTNVLGGGLVAEKPAFVSSYYDFRKTFYVNNGTTFIFGDVDVPCWQIQDGAHVIVSNATLTSGSYDVGNVALSVFRTGTIDLLAGGRLVGGKNVNAMMAQGAASRVSTVNVYDGGFFETVSGHFRTGDDGMTCINVYDGGRVDWKAWASFSQGGACQLSVCGGELFVRPFDGRLQFGAWRGKNAGVGDDRFVLKGGTTYACGLYNGATQSGLCHWVDFDGGTLAAAYPITEPYYLKKADAYADGVVARVFEGGLKFDTCGHDITWGPLVLESAGANDGGFTKRGLGTFTLDAACTYVGPTRVEAGTFVLAASSASKSLVLANGASATISDASYFTGALDLASSSSLSFGGAALSVTSLASEGGRIRLTLAADDAGQRVAATSTSFAGDGLRFELVDADGAAWSANGTYTLLTQTGLDASAANAVSVANPVAGKTYAFAVADGALQVTIADGDTPANTLIVTSDTTLSDPIDVAGTLYVHVAEGCTLTLTGEVRAGEDAKIVVYGPGALEIVAANSVPVEVRDGATVTISAATALAGGIALDAGTTLSAAADVALDCMVDAATGASFTAAEGKTLDLSGVTLPHGGYVVAGAGRVKMFNAEGVVAAVTGTLALDAAPAAPLALANGSVVYEGAADAVFTQKIIVPKNMDSTYNTFSFSLAEGAGSVTLDMPFSAVDAFNAWFRTAPENEFVVRDLNTGLGSNSALTNRKLFFGAGNFRFTDGSKISVSTDSNSLRFGEHNSGRKGATHATIEASAKLSVGGVQLAPQMSGALDSDVVVEQVGGTVKANGLSFGPGARLTNKATYTLADGTFDASSSACNFIAGDTALAVSGGEMNLGYFGFGYWGGSNSSFCDDALWQGYRQSIDVSGGALSFLNGFSWLSCYDRYRRLNVTVRGEGSLSLPATTADCEEWSARDEYLVVQSTLALDGGRFAIGAGDDALHGLDELVVGAGGARILAAADATVSQRLRGTATTGGIVKEGPGSLAFTAKDNVLFGDVDVREGTLALGLSSQPHKPWPYGLVALWNFDGAEPLKDKTGRGLDLIQLHEADHPVSITAGNESDGLAHDGTSAYWPVNGGSFAMTNAVTFAFNAQTVSFWTRLKDFTSQSGGLISFLSTRSALKKDPSSASWGEQNGIADGNWCICLNSGTHRFEGNMPIYNGIEKEDMEAKFQPGTWHMVTQVREGTNDWEYIDGIPVRWDSDGIYKNGKSGGIRPGNAKVVLKAKNALFTIGQTYGGYDGCGERLNDGAMMDDVAIFSRALSAEEVKALYDQSAAASVTLKPAVKVASGATWDMCGSSLSTDLLAGGGNVVNGTLSIAGAIKLEAGASLHVATPVFPSADVTVDLGCDADEPAAYGRYVVIAHDAELDADSAANVAGWKATGLGRANFRGRAVVSADAAAKQVVIDVEPPGTVLIVK